MKKIIKTFISMVLVISMMTMMIATSFAKNDQNSRAYISATEISDNINEIDLGEGYLLRTQDYDNGDAKITLFLGNEWVSSSYVTRANGQVSTTVIKDGVTTTTTEVVNPSKQRAMVNSSQIDSNNQPYFAAANTFLGAIRYQYITSSTTGYCTAALYYSRTYDPTSRYNINGVYTNLVAFVGFIVAICAFPGAIAGVVAAKVLSILGIATGAIGFAIGTHYVDTDKTVMDWTLIDNNDYSHQINMRGEKFVVTQPGYAATAHYDGDYFETSAYVNHDTVFGMTVFSKLFSYPYYSILW